MNLKIQLPAFDPPPEFFLSYDRILVSFSGGEGSLAALLSLMDREVPPHLIELLYRHEEGREIQGIPICTEYCEFVAKLLGVRISPLPTIRKRKLTLLKYIVRKRECLYSSTLIVSGERRVDYSTRQRLMQFENDPADNRFPGKHKRRLRYVDRYRPVLHYTEKQTQDIIDKFGIIDFLYGEN